MWPGANPLKSVFPEEPQISLREEPQVPFNGLLCREDLWFFPKTCMSSLKIWVSESLQGRRASLWEEPQVFVKNHIFNGLENVVLPNVVFPKVLLPQRRRRPDKRLAAAAKTFPAP